MNVAKSQFLRAFNVHFFEFLDAAIDFFPGNADVATAKTSAFLLKKANPTCIIKAWHVYLTIPYAREIADGDVDYFANKDYSHDLVDFDCSGSGSGGGSGGGNDSLFKIIDDLRVVVRDASEDQKNSLFRYIQNLSMLSTQYIDSSGGGGGACGF